MDSVMKSLVICILVGCTYGAPADTISFPDVKRSQHVEKKTFEVDGGPLTETVEDTDDGPIIEVDAQRGNGALTVFADVTHGLLVHRYDNDENCYISSLADYNNTRSLQENPSSVFKYRLEPISKINGQYFSHTATDAMKRVCNGASDVFWSEVNAVSDKDETREKRRTCYIACGLWCSLIECNYVCLVACERE